MEIDLFRGTSDGVSIIGEMMNGSAHLAWTLERPAVAIPSGRYQITLYPSPHFGRMMPMLNGVPGRSYIEIHFGNYPGESDGCILVGDSFSTDAVWNSVLKFNELFPLIQNAVNTQAGCWITVVDPQ